MKLLHVPLIPLFVLLFINQSCDKSESVSEEQQINIPENNSWTIKDFSLLHDGKVREYTLYKPNGFTSNAPLVMLLHGYTGNKDNIMNYSKMNDLAEAHGFMVCYPQGTVNENTNQTHWNANLTFSSVDDTGFLSELAIAIQEEFETNPKHTFVAGMSNGGFMSYTLACERPDIFKGIASITGTMSGYDWNNCNPQQGMSVMQMSGTQDRVVPWDGSMSTQGGWGGAPHIFQVIDLWAEVNECTLTETIDFPNIVTSDNSTASVYKYTTEFDNRQVWFYQIDGGGHQWPGWGGSGNQDISASQEIWKFFEKLILNT